MMAKRTENYERVAYNILLVAPELLEKYVNRHFPSSIMNFKEPFKEKLPPEDWNQMEELIGRCGLHRFYNHLNNPILYRTVLDDLICKKVMSVNDRYQICVKRTHSEKNKTLLDILIKKPGDNYNAFIEALRKSKENRQFVDHLVNTGNVGCQTEMKIQVRKNYKRLISEIDSNAILDKLYEEDVLNDDENDEIKDCKITSEKNRRVLDIVIQKSEYERFLNALRADQVYRKLVDTIKATEVTETEIQSTIQEEQKHECRIDVSTMVTLVSVLFKTSDISFGADRLKYYIREIINKDDIDDEMMKKMFPEITEILVRLDGPEAVDALQKDFKKRKKELIDTLKKLKDKDKFNTEIADILTKDLSDVTVYEGCDAKFEIWTNENIKCTKWFKGESQIASSDRFEIDHSGTNHSLKIYTTNLSDKGVYTVRLHGAERRARLEVKEYFTKSPKSTTTCLEGEDIDLSCEVPDEKAAVVWRKDGYELNNSTKYKINDHGKTHKLSIMKTELNDSGNYSVQVNDRKRITKLTTKEYFSTTLKNKECLEGDDVSFECEILEEDKVARWSKDDVEVQTSKKYKIQIQGRRHQLHIINATLNDEGEYRVLIKNCLRKCSLTVREKPTRSLSDEDKSLYLDTIKSVTETRFYIRIIIIGENGVGKTCLLRRLLKTGIEDVKSTDGIDIQRCKIRKNDGTWIYVKVTDKRKELITRLKSAIVDQTPNHDYSVTEKGKGKTSGHESSHNKHKPDYFFNAQDNSHDAGQESSYNNLNKIPSVDSPNSTNKSQTVRQKGEQPNNTHPALNESIQPNTTVEQPMHRDAIDNILSKNIVQELSLFLDDIESSEISNEILVDCGFWDFAGQREYYPTHPIFLNRYALHLLVADITKDIKPIKVDKGFDQIGEYLDFWFDSVHSLRDLEPEKGNNQQKLNPPVILVCTNSDKIKDSTDANKIKERTNNFLRQLNESVSDEKRKHLRKIVCVSNTESTEEEFDELRKLIFEFGKEMETFGEQLPLKYIRLERALDIVRETGINILSWLDVTTLAFRCSFSTETEIKLFLKYQHKIGNIVYFEKLNETIILNQKWLADAFRCLISVRFDEAVKVTPEWRELEESGQLADNLIAELFQKEPKLNFSKYRNHILNVMEMFGIIFKLTFLTAGGVRKTPTYYMPSMITFKSTIEDIKIKFCASSDGCLQSPWLCIKFDFMPLDVFNNIMCEFISQYNVCKVPGTERMALYHGLGVFDLNDTELQKLVICFCKDTIALQIWQIEPIEKGKYKEIVELLRLWISRYQTKYESRKLPYTVMTKCSDGDIHNPDGKKSYAYLLSKEKYPCYHDKKPQIHWSKEFLETWFFNYSEAIKEDVENTKQDNKNVIQSAETRDLVDANLLPVAPTDSDSDMYDMFATLSESHINQERYRFRSGIAVVVNNENFYPKLMLPDRIGCVIDAVTLNQRLLDLGFEVDFMYDATHEDILHKFDQIKEDEDTLVRKDCLVVVVSTYWKGDCIYATNKKMKIKHIVHAFNTSNCPALALKPKIFIFQKCTVQYEAGVAAVHAEYDETIDIPNEADFLAGYSSSPNYVRYLSEELKEMKKGEDIYKVLRRVNRKVTPFYYETKYRNPLSNELQTSCFVSHLTKELVLKQ